MRDVIREKLAKDKARDSGYRKAAQFLMLLGPDEAANVIKHLSHEEVEGVTLEIAQIRRIEENDAKKIFDEFGCLARSKELVAQGGLGKAREMLIAAFGDEKGETFYNKLRLKTAFQPFSFLEDLDLGRFTAQGRIHACRESHSRLPRAETRRKYIELTTAGHSEGHC